MADFKLSAEIIMQADRALKEIDKVEKSLQSTKREFNLLGRTVKLDTDRIVGGIKKITAIAGGMFAAMSIASPSMRAAFKQMELAALETNIALGEQLAPTIEATLVPAFNILRDTILNLRPDQQELIALTITLTFVIGLLVLIIGALTIEFLLVAAAIIAVALLIAAIIVYWDKITEAVVNFISKIPGIDSFLEAIIGLKDAVLRFWDVAKPIFKVLLLASLLAIVPAIALISVGIAAMVTAWLLIIPAITLVMEIFTGFLNFISGIMEAIVLLITGNFDEAWDKVLETFSDLIKNMIDAIGDFVDSIGDALKMVWKGMGDLAHGAFAGIFNKIIDFINEFVFDNISKAITVINKIPKVNVPQLTWRIPSMQEGGVVERTGLIFAHKGEEVLRATEARQYRQQRTGTSGGNTFNFYNTFKIGSVNNRSQMLAFAREAAAQEKREMNRRFHA